MCLTVELLVLVVRYQAGDQDGVWGVDHRLRGEVWSGLAGQGHALVHGGGRQTCLEEEQTEEAGGVENQCWMCGRYPTQALAERC